MTKLALAVAALLLPLFPLSFARYVPLGLPDTETETLPLSDGEGHEPVAIPLPLEKPSPVDGPFDGPKAAASSRPPMIQIEIKFVPVGDHFREAAAAAARPWMMQIEISFVLVDGRFREAAAAARPRMIQIEICFIPVDGHFRKAAATSLPRMIQIEISFVPVDGHVRHPLPPHQLLGHGCRLLCWGPHGGTSRLTAIPLGADTVVPDQHVQRTHAEDKGTIPGGEHRLLQPVRAERMGVNAEGTGEASVMELVKETKTEPPRELRPFARWLQQRERAARGATASSGDSGSPAADTAAR